MKAFYALLLFVLISCNSPEPEEVTDSSGSSTQLNGATLYQQNCFKCHGDISTSPKTDMSGDQIHYAIQDIVRMNHLEFLNYDQIMAISKALSSSNPLKIPPKIISAAPNGKHVGATTSLNLSVTTDMASTCSYDSLDVSFDSMQYTLSSSTDSLTHSRSITLSPGASYKFYVHCKEVVNGNITKVSQLVSFSTDLDAVDTTKPVLSGFYPNAPLLGGTEKTKFFLNTNESATCRYSTDSSADYSQMVEMGTTGTLGHVQIVSSLSGGVPYIYYVICADPTGNESDKGTINFSILTQVDGSQLYAANCKSCHGAIGNSSKRGSSPSEISGAIEDFGAMRIENLQFLSPTQIQALSDSL